MMGRALMKSRFQVNQRRELAGASSCSAELSMVMPTMTSRSHSIAASASYATPARKHWGTCTSLEAGGRMRAAALPNLAVAPWQHAVPHTAGTSANGQGLTSKQHFEQA